MRRDQKNRLTDKWWRMDNLYQIVDKQGQVVKFCLNGVQQNLFEDLHNLNVILKARQQGITSAVDIFILDECLFNSNVEGGIVAHNKDDAQQIFRRKIQFPYEHLDPDIKRGRRLVTDSKSEMGFSNGSVVHVGTTMRSATLQYLHVSELGKIAAAYPEKAREIMTGTLEAVSHQGTTVFIEGTGEGKSGAFFDLCESARKVLASGKALTPMDYRFHFFPWYGTPDYALHNVDVEITAQMEEYFRELQSKTKYIFSHGQKAWYIKKHSVLGDDVKREYPATPDEAFESGIMGQYLRSQFIRAREEGRITKVPVQDGVVVDTWWDLGMDDSMTVWFTQDVGREVHVVDYLENSGEGLEYYRDRLDERARDRKFRYGRMVAPHDIKVRELGTGVSRLETAHRLGIPLEVAPPVEHKIDGIQKIRSIFGILWFDEEHCSAGIEKLERWRKEWDELHGVYKETPLHDDASHAADGLQTLAVAHDFRPAATAHARVSARPVRVPSAKGWT